MSDNSSRTPVRTRSATERVFRAAGKWLASFVLVTVTAGFGSCSGGGGGGPQGYLHLQGSVSGLSPGQSVVLQIDGNGTTAVSANGSFQFSVLLAAGDPYSVTVFTQPIGEICSIVNGTGTGTVRAGSSVTIACTPGTYTVSGMVTGATGPVGLQLYLDVNDSTTPIGPPLTVVGTQVNVPVPFTLIATAPLGTPYEVTVPGDPPYEQCGVDDNTPVFGLGTADVTGAVITCGWLTGVTVTGLSPNSSVTLGISYEQLNSGQIITAPVTVTANGDCGAQCLANATVNHPNTVAVTSQPAGEICTVGAAQGTPGQAEVFVPVVCTPGTYTVSGMVTGATGPVGLQLYLDVNDSTTPIGPPLTVVGTQVNVPVPFTLIATAPLGTPYEVTVPGDPPYEQCGVDDNTPVFGLGTADVTGAVITCGWLTGVTVTGLSPNSSVTLGISYEQLNSGQIITAPVTVTANGDCGAQCLANATVNHPNTVAVTSQPAGETCTVGAPQGTPGQAEVFVPVVCTPGTYTVSGMVTGATGPVGLQLYLDVNDSTTPIGPPLTVVGTQVNVPVPFTLIATAPLGTPYEVTVPGDPPYEQCGVDDNTPVFGLGTADVTGAVITCGWLTGVTVTGLSPNSSVTLGISYEQLNSGQIITAPVTVTANGDCGAQCLANATVNHPNTVAVTSQPAGEICTVGAPQGTPGQAEVFVPVVCSPGSYTIGGVVTGLFAGESVVLQDNGGNATSVSANGPFTFSTQVAYQSPYAVTVATQPAGENCSITNGSGMTPAANVNNVAVACAASSYTIGGTISGLASGKTIVLQDNGGNATTVSANGQFTFSTAIAYQSPYAVTIATQPAGQSCSVTNGSGTTPAANVTNISVVCVPGYTIGGAVSGLSGGKSVVLRDNGSNATTVSANGPFTFSTALANQSPYAVTVATPPVGETCTVTNGSGTVAAANVTNIAVACTAASYTIGGTVSGLSAGESVVLENNGGNATTVSANGPF